MHMTYDNYKINAMPALITAIKAALAADEATRAMSGNVYPIIAPFDTDGGVVVVRQQGETPERSKFGIARTTGHYRAYCTSDDYTEATTAAAAIARAIEGATLGDGRRTWYAGTQQDIIDGRPVAAIDIDVTDN